MFPQGPGEGMILLDGNAYHFDRWQSCQSLSAFKASGTSHWTLRPHVQTTARHAGLGLENVPLQGVSQSQWRPTNTLSPRVVCRVLTSAQQHWK